MVLILRFPSPYPRGRRDRASQGESRAGSAPCCRVKYASQGDTSKVNANGMNTPMLIEGTTIYDTSGDKVGTLNQYDAQGNYLVAQKGLLFPHDIYIPLSAVERSDADGIYLNLTREDLRDERYKTAPALSATSSMTQTAILDQDVAPPTTSTSRSTVGTPARAETANQNDIEVPVREEELIARKQQGEVGRVHIHKDVVAEPESINVPVTREEVRVERVPVEGAAAGDIGPDAFQNKDIDVPVMSERVNVRKVARVGEEIHVHKQQVTEQERYDDTVRKERVEVEGLDQQGNLLPEQGNGVPPAQP